MHLEPFFISTWLYIHVDMYTQPFSISTWLYIHVDMYMQPFSISAWLYIHVDTFWAISISAWLYIHVDIAIFQKYTTLHTRRHAYAATQKTQHWCCNTQLFYGFHTAQIATVKSTTWITEQKAHIRFCCWLKPYSCGKRQVRQIFHRKWGEYCNERSNR